MPPKRSNEATFCHRCENAKILRNARYKCLQCKERMCPECTQNHMILRPCLDFRVIDMRSGKSVDSVFSIEPDSKGETKEIIKTGHAESITSSESPYQVVRSYGKPVFKLVMSNTKKIMIPIPSNIRASKDSLNQSRSSLESLNQNSIDYLDDTAKTVDILHDAETAMSTGDFNENGDFFPSRTNNEPKPKQSILKRTTSFNSKESNSLWNIETPSSGSQTGNSNGSVSKKEVRFNTLMNTITEEQPAAISREYSNSFYQMLGKQNCKKESSEPVKKPKPPLKMVTKRAYTGLPMVSQCSIVIGHQEVTGKISGVLFLNDKYLIVIDRVNHKMKVFNATERYRMVIDKEIPKGSWGLTSPEDNIIAMTCRNKIMFYGLFENKTPRYEKPQDPVIQPLDVEYRIRASCYGIGFCESRDLFFVACNVFFSDPSIFIVDTKGHTQHIIRTVDDGLSPTIPFSETLAVDSDRGVLYIGDRVGKRIVCTTYNGKHVWNVPLSGKPVSLTCDREHIYACLNGRIISVVHKDGRFLRNIISLDLDGRRICYHESSNQLVVLTKAFWGVSHFIQVYQV